MLALISLLLAVLFMYTPLDSRIKGECINRGCGSSRVSSGR